MGSLEVSCTARCRELKVVTLTSGTEWRVGLNDDTLVVAVLFQFVLGVVWVVFDLVDGRDDLPGLGEVFQDRNTSIGNSNSLDLALGEDGLHLLPSLGLVPVPVDVSRAVLFHREELVRAILDCSAGLSADDIFRTRSTRLTWASGQGRDRDSRFPGT
jgi:hypothetical protein